MMRWRVVIVGHVQHEHGKLTVNGVYVKFGRRAVDMKRWHEIRPVAPSESLDDPHTH